MILTTEGVITAALNVIAATTTVILAKEEVITASLKIISAIRKEFLAANELVSATEKIYLIHYTVILALKKWSQPL